MFKEFEGVFSQKGRLEGHEINAQFKENCVPKQQNGRRIPLQLQNSVEIEIKKLIKMRHIEKVNEINEETTFLYNPQLLQLKKTKA